MNAGREPTTIAARAFAFPESGETLAALADRLFPGDADAADRLLSWNLHLAVRRSPVGGPGALLSTDIVYLDAPEHGPVITGAELIAGHDGRAEVLIELVYDDGARRTVTVTEEAAGSAIDAARVTELDELIGRRWTVLLGTPDADPPVTAGAP